MLEPERRGFWVIEDAKDEGYMRGSAESMLGIAKRALSCEDYYQNQLLRHPGKEPTEKAKERDGIFQAVRRCYIFWDDMAGFVRRYPHMKPETLAEYVFAQTEYPYDSPLWETDGADGQEGGTDA